MNNVPDIYVMHLGAGTNLTAMQHAAVLRAAGLNLYVHCGDQSLKAQLRKADASGASMALIIGQEEQINNTVTLKNLRTHEQQTVSADTVLKLIQDWKNA